MSALSAVRGVWRRIAPGPLRRAAAPLIAPAVRAYAELTVRRRWESRARSGPIRVVGFFDESHGIAAAARMTARSLESLGAEVDRVSVSGRDFGWLRSFRQKLQASAWIFQLNPPELVALLAELGADQPQGPRFGYWAWELPKAPESWLAAGGLVSEIWTPSSYTARALKGAAAPVRVVPHPLFMEDFDGVQPLPRAVDFLAVSLFDFNSSVARKNPQGAIEAFRIAFGEDPNARLILKTQNGDLHREALAALRASAPGNVEILDATWPFSRVLSLIRSSDALVSLHRAEGFGLTLAEAMAMGTPVVATGWSANLDFMDATCAMLIPSQPTDVEDPQGIYRGQTWAQPDVKAAADALARLRKDPQMASGLAAAARRRIMRQLSPQAWLTSLPPLLQASAIQ
jgi:glycosyltransferase involved in cell wall biosynthesis